MKAYQVTAQPRASSASATKATAHTRPTVTTRAGVSLSPVYRKAQRQAQQQRRQEQLAAKKNGNASTPAFITPVSGPASTSYDILEAFFYGRAFAITLSKRLGEIVVDAVAEVSKAAAERPQRIQEFQEEVAQLARKEMAAASVPERPSSITPASPSSALASSSSSAASNNGTSQPQDLEALVDDLRAEIATARSVLQSIKTNGKSGSAPGLPTPAGGEKSMLSSP